MAMSLTVKSDLQANIDVNGPVQLNVDFGSVPMTDAQRAVMEKLLAAVRADGPLDVSDPTSCEAGACRASKYLTEDEFKQVRGLKAQMSVPGIEAYLIADSCLHVVIV
jgi:hypothetical protein